jgi:PIF1-like helicase
MFFVSGVAGTGKTHTYKYLYDSLTAKGYKVVCLAFTGVAAALLPNGKTLHSALGLPVPLTRDSESRLQPFMQQLVTSYSGSITIFKKPHFIFVDTNI